MREHVVIIGANEHQTPLIKRAQECGFETHVFAWQMREPGEYQADHFYPISITEYGRILECCKEIKPVAALTICSDLTAGTVAMLNKNLQLTGNSPEIVDNCVNKLRMKKLVNDIGIDQPCYMEGDDALSYDCFEKLDYPLVVKPADRSGGRGVRLVYNKEELLNAISYAKDYSFSKKAIVEQFIEGTPMRVECISDKGLHYVVAVTVDEIAYVNDMFIEKSHSQGNCIDSRLKEQISELAVKVLEAIGYCYGASSVEFIVDNNGKPYLIEVNASMCGDFVGTHLVPFTTGYDYLQGVLNISLGRENNRFAITDRGNATVRFILNKKDYSCLKYLRENKPDKILLDSEFKNENILPERDSKYRYGYYVYEED